MHKMGLLTTRLPVQLLNLRRAGLCENYIKKKHDVVLIFHNILLISLKLLLIEHELLLIVFIWFSSILHTQYTFYPQDFY